VRLAVGDLVSDAAVGNDRVIRVHIHSARPWRTRFVITTVQLLQPLCI